MTSPEQQTMIKCTPQLTTAVQADIVTLSGLLMGQGLIPEAKHTNSCNEFVPVQTRAAALVNCVRDRVSLSKDNYQKFVDVLVSCGDQYRDLLDIMERTYKSVGGQTAIHRQMDISSLPQLRSIPIPSSESSVLRSGQQPEDCMHDVFRKWFDDAPQLPGSKTYPLSWRGLYRILMDSQKSELAKELLDALSSDYSTVRNSYPEAGDRGVTPPVERPLPKQEVRSHSEQYQPQGSHVSFNDAEKTNDEDSFMRWLKEIGLGDEDRSKIENNGVTEPAFKKLKSGHLLELGLTLGGRLILEDHLQDSAKVPLATHIVKEQYTSSVSKESVSLDQQTQPKKGILCSRDHLQIRDYLYVMKNEDIVLLGQALGLSRAKLLRMNSLPSEMIDAWLSREDDVITESGDPTWESLAAALDRIDQAGIADKIRQRRS